ncbi:shikimate kinase [Chryseobacterium sp. MP_3.2]|uniref:shikimate kinase n=1 Tax=Chryseobacterium sp. MP_3.2 TaxID=3071712 RepID=UPI002E002609|nr:shikimate kinase [Chryseobacterium sp. MP_3.2]
MIISLVGYMGSGKSHVSKVLSTQLGLKLIDLDQQISTIINMPISEIFDKKGEIYFRKVEREILENILATEKKAILSVGGGTPVYYDNMDLINKNSESIFLRTSVPTLAKRVSIQRFKRPLIANIPDEDLNEFIAKHLFERNFYYAKAKYAISTDQKSVEEIAAEIILLINPTPLPH